MSLYYIELVSYRVIFLSQYPRGVKVPYLVKIFYDLISCYNFVFISLSNQGHLLKRCIVCPFIWECLVRCIFINDHFGADVFLGGCRESLNWEIHMWPAFMELILETRSFPKCVSLLYIKENVGHYWCVNKSNYESYRFCQCIRYYKYSKLARRK